MPSRADSPDIKGWLREEALRLGFPRVGFTHCGNLADEDGHRSAWLREGGGALFPYLDHPDALAPSKWMEAARTAMVAFLPYARPEAVPGAVPGSLKLSRYLWGRDYHAIMKGRLKRLMAKASARWPELESRVCVDTVPIPERDLAERAGLGWKGKHTLLIAGKGGSWGFLGVVLLSLDLDPDPPFGADRCGSCMACLEACPTGALAPFRLDPRLCLTTYNLETELEPPGGVAVAMARTRWAAGCDACQEACPWNQDPLWGETGLWGGASPLHTLPEPELPRRTAQWQKLTRGTALRRVRHRHWLATLERVVHISLD